MFRQGNRRPLGITNFLNALDDELNMIDTPMIIGGDFNLVMHQMDKI